MKGAFRAECAASTASAAVFSAREAIPTARYAGPGTPGELAASPGGAPKSALFHWLCLEDLEDGSATHGADSAGAVR